MLRTELMMSARLPPLLMVFLQPVIEVVVPRVVLRVLLVVRALLGRTVRRILLEILDVVGSVPPLECRVARRILLLALPQKMLPERLSKLG